MQDALRYYATEILNRWATGEQSTHLNGESDESARLNAEKVKLAEDKIFEQAHGVFMRDDVMLACTLIVIVLSVIALWKVSGAVFHIWGCIKNSCAVTIRVTIWSVLLVLVFFYSFNEEQRYHMRGLASTTSQAVMQHRVYNWSREFVSNYTKQKSAEHDDFR